jgi:hypothetical protein
MGVGRMQTFAIHAQVSRTPLQKDTVTNDLDSGAEFPIVAEEQQDERVAAEQKAL